MMARTGGSWIDSNNLLTQFSFLIWFLPEVKNPLCFLKHARVVNYPRGKVTICVGIQGFTFCSGATSS